jgi:hypothetical protein
MIISAHQPYFAPFAGFFYKAHLSDVFVLLDEVQFPRGTTWVSRNRFKNDKGALWITIPVWKKGLGLQSIGDVRICHEGRWREKHLESLKTAYSHAPYMDDHGPFLEEIFSGTIETLADLNVRIIKHLMTSFFVEARLVLQSELGVSAGGTKLLIDLSKRAGCSTFLAQSASEKYLSAEEFHANGIELETFRYPEIIYPQLWGDFVPNLSAFDLLLNCGPKARDILCGYIRRRTVGG